MERHLKLRPPSYPLPAVEVAEAEVAAAGEADARIALRQNHKGALSADGCAVIVPTLLLSAALTARQARASALCSRHVPVSRSGCPGGGVPCSKSLHSGRSCAPRLRLLA
ncbi:hypothetical protein MPLA_1360028 [Mesorhizobium sp. ORS 3359]|nr:hypothetical protein MPLA_1360028 [Mesorhizobium sp. ORS 3359]